MTSPANPLGQKIYWTLNASVPNSSPAEWTDEVHCGIVHGWDEGGSVSVVQDPTIDPLCRPADAGLALTLPKGSWRLTHDGKETSPTADTTSSGSGRTEAG